MTQNNKCLAESKVEIVFDVVPDPKAQPHLPSGAGAPLFREGVVFALGSRSLIGRYTSWGVAIRPENERDHEVLHEAFRIEGRGTFFTVGFIPGVCPSGSGFRRAVIGGTGEFAGIRGEAPIELRKIRDNADAFRLTVTLFHDEGQQKPRDRFKLRGILNRWFPKHTLQPPQAAATFYDYRKPETFGGC
jgi:hypothetical protein